jgi:ATP-dependent RNA helicase DDX21
VCWGTELQSSAASHHSCNGSNSSSMADKQHKKSKKQEKEADATKSETEAVKTKKDKKRKQQEDDSNSPAVVDKSEKKAKKQKKEAKAASATAETAAENGKEGEQASAAVAAAAAAAPDANALDNFKLSENIKSLLRSKGIESLFAIQAACFDTVLDGKDVVGRARTGCGKTLAFVLPIVQVLTDDGAGPGGKRAWGRPPSVIVLAPTRELAKQVGLTLHCSAGNPPAGQQLKSSMGQQE